MTPEQHETSSQQEKISTPESQVTPEHILEIHKRGIGIRFTSQEGVKEEVENGAYADFLTTYNLSELLHPPAEIVEAYREKLKQNNYNIPDSDLKKNVVEGLLQKDQTEALLQSSPDLTERFTQGIKDHLQKIILRNMMDRFQKNDTVSRMFKDDIPTLLPGVTIIEKGPNPQKPYDLENYYPFGKYGKHHISPEEIIGGVTLTSSDEEWQMLKDDYMFNMNEQLLSKAENGNTYHKEIEDKILEIYINKIFSKIFETNTKNA